MCAAASSTERCRHGFAVVQEASRATNRNETIPFRFGSPGSHDNGHVKKSRGKRPSFTARPAVPAVGPGAVVHRNPTQGDPRATVRAFEPTPTTNGRVVQVRDWIVAIVTAIGLPLALIGLLLTYISLERDTLRFEYTTSSELCASVSRANAAVTGVLTNTGRMPITVVGFAPEGGDTVARSFEWIDLLDRDLTVRRDIPVLLEPGRAVVVRAWSSDSTIKVPFGVWRSDGVLQEPELARPVPDTPAISAAKETLDHCPSA